MINLKFTDPQHEAMAIDIVIINILKHNLMRKGKILPMSILDG